MTKTTALLFILILIFFLLLLGIQAATMRELQYKIDSLSEDISLLFWETGRLHDVVQWMVEDRENQEREAILELRDFLLGVQVQEFEVTAYAPLDPNAIEGICYSGNPNVTASGLPPIPGETVAAGPSIPFGSRVWLEDIGWRVAEDCGGAIRGHRIDLYVGESKADALAWGKRKVRGVVL